MPAKRPAKEFTATEVGVLIENFDHKLTVVAEGQSSLRRDVDGLKDMMGRLMGEVSEVRRDVNVLRTDMTTGFAELKFEVKATRTDLAKFDKRVTAIEVKVASA